MIKVSGENGESSSSQEREAVDSGAQDDGNGEPPAIVIYIVDPFRLELMNMMISETWSLPDEDRISFLKRNRNLSFSQFWR